MSEPTTPTKRAISPFEVALKEYLARQRTLLRLVDFVDEKSVDLDDPRSLIVDQLTKRYGSVDPKAIDAVGDIFQVMQNDALLPEDQTAEVDRLITLAHGLVPGGHLVSVMVRDAIAASRDEPGVPLLFSSMLTSLVGNFELLIARLARMAYQRNPLLAEMGDRRFTWQEIVAHGSLDSFQESIIERVADKLVRESFDSWMEHFSKKLGVKVPGELRDYQVREVFQRRNVVVHNGGAVSSVYLEAMPELKSPPTIGEKLPVDRKYMNSSADRLSALALHLVWQIGRRRLTGLELTGFEAYVCDVPYQLLRDGRVAVAELQAEHLLAEDISRDKAKIILQVNYWLAKKRQGRLSECAAEVEAWQTSALAPEFRLAQLALLDEVEKGALLARQLIESRSLSIKDWLTWPLLDELREHERGLLLPAHPEIPATGVVPSTGQLSPKETPVGNPDL